MSVLGLCKEFNQFTGLPAVRAGFISNVQGGLKEFVWPLFFALWTSHTRPRGVLASE